MTGKTKYLSGFAGLIALGIAFAGIRHRESPAPTPTVDQPRPDPATRLTQTNPLPQSPGFASMDPVANDLVDPQDWVQNGSKEPLVPRELHVEAELAPGSILTAEPLVPKELHVDTELAPGETLNTAPLTPPEIHVGNPAR